MNDKKPEATKRSEAESYQAIAVEAVRLSTAEPERRIAGADKLKAKNGAELPSFALG